MSGKTRGLFKIVAQNFVNSLKPRQTKGKYIGDDYHGNKYYEIAADPSRGKRHPKRWFVPTDETRYEQETMPSEWDAWLRLRRENAPSEDEMKSNLTISVMKKENADKIAEKEGKNLNDVPKHADMSSFPVYDDFEVTPGVKKRQK